ncbi:MAG: competence/damage-inducible protein A [Calditrichia bacterium]
MKAEIISIGNELLNGNTVNSNATYIAAALSRRGIRTHWIQTISDDDADIRQALKTAFPRSRLILLTGGLGPTHDDITKKTVADFFDLPLINNEETARKVEERFRSRGLNMPPINRSQSLVPEGAGLLDNPLGTAPGIVIRRQDKTVVLLPGVPREMRAIVDERLPAILEEFPQVEPLQVETIRTTGIAESEIYQRLEARLNEFREYEIAFLPHFTGVDLRVMRPKTGRDYEQKWKNFKNLLDSKIGEYIYTYDERELAEVIGGILQKKEQTLAVAESLSGGLLQDWITAVPGSSRYFTGGIVAYNNEAKVRQLNVQQDTLNRFGAVSPETAREMAAGVREAFGSDFGISTTGIAGPGGATPQKEVGLVFIAVASEKSVKTQKFLFGKDRRINKQRSAQAGLEMLRRVLLNIGE